MCNGPHTVKLVYADIVKNFIYIFVNSNGITPIVCFLQGSPHSRLSLAGGLIKIRPLSAGSWGARSRRGKG